MRVTFWRGVVWKINILMCVGEETGKVGKVIGSGSGRRYLLVVFHMLEELDGNDAVVCFRLKFKVHDITRYDGQVLEAFSLRDRVDILLLRARV
jgi:hypothetical protein